MINLSHMSNLTLAILGLSRSGMASVAALAAAGATVYVHDDHAIPTLPKGVIALPPAEWPWGEISSMVISPGIPHEFPAPHPAVSLARAHEVEVISDIELMMRAAMDAPCIAVTGTNGKSTVVSLIKHIFDYCGIPASLGGNIGTPALSLNNPGKDGVIILELSSYQLETTPSLRLDVGAVINVTPDHLDRHDGWDGYVAAKAALVKAVKPSGLLVLGDDQTAISLAAQSPCPVVIARGMDAPDRSQAPDLTGPHNAINTAIAAEILKQFGISEDQVKAALPSFNGLPHRMEHLGAMNGIQFINDSKATNGEATAEALQSFENIYLIAGGIAKGEGLGVAAHHLGQVRRAYLIGDAADQFARQLDAKSSEKAGKTCPYIISETLEAATHSAFADATSDKGDAATILLSPAAASFDQFNSFEHRGDAFRALATSIINAEPTREVRHV